MADRIAKTCPVCLERIMPWKETTVPGRGGRVYHERCWNNYWTQMDRDWTQNSRKANDE
jgi:hypothetical protein